MTKAGGRGRGLPNSSDAAQNGEKLYSRLAPPAGVRRILRATPFAADPFQLVAIAVWGAWFLRFGTINV